VIHWLISLSPPLLVGRLSSRAEQESGEKKRNRNDVIWYSRGAPKAIAVQSFIDGA
jgi:hypothetical protein